MKKLCAYALSVLVLCSSFPGFAKAVQGSEADEAIFNVKSIGLMQGYENGEFHAEKEISRAEFAAVATRLCGVLSNPGLSETPFSDVSSDMWASGYISYAHSLGLINGFEDQTFKPNDMLTHAQALKIIVCALGYGMMAEEYGGYPNGYFVVASNLGVTKGVYADINTNVTRGDVAVYLDNALDVHPLEKVYTSKGDSYEVSSETLYEKLSDNGETKVEEGIINDNGITSLTGESKLEPGQIEVNGKVYNAQSANWRDYLGQSVRLSITNIHKKIPTVKAISVMADVNNVLTIKADEAENIKKSGITYYVSEDKTKTISFESTDNFIYNGKAVKKSELTDSFLKICNGDYTLVDADDDRKYETLFINEYESFAIERVYAPGKTVYFKNNELYNGRSGFKFLSDDEDAFISLSNADGTPAAFDDIKPGCVLTLSASLDGKVCSAVISNEVVSGKVSELYSSDNGISVDGKRYRIAVSKSNVPKLEVALGDEANFVLDFKGDIVSTDGQKLSGEKYGYVTNVKQASFSGNAKIQIASYGSYERIVKKEDNTEEIYYEYRNGDLQVLELSQKSRVNGSDDYNVADLKDHIIGYSTDSEGKVKNITVYGNSYDKYTLNFNSDIVSFGGYTNAENFFIGESTNVICVPLHADSEDDYYEIVKLTDGTDYSVYPVNIDADSQVAEAVMIVANMDADVQKPIDEDAKFSIVGEVSTVVDDEGGECVKIKLLTGDEVTEEICKETSDSINIAKSLRKGDIIKYSLENDESIDKIEKRATVQGLKKYYNINKNSPVEEIYGMAKSVKLNRLSPLKNEVVDEVEIMLGSDESAPYFKYEILKKDGPEVYLYERSRGNIYTATGDDIESYLEAGEDACDIFMLINSNNPEVVVIIKD